ncbi:MAG: serine hydrolase domain-containing protein [Pseudomonadota bacterium]
MKDEFWKRGIAIVLMFVTVVVFGSQALGQDRDAFQRTIAAYPQLDRLPGYAAVAIRDGQLVGEAAGGDIDLDTPTEIGSLSKSFTALAVMVLVEAGQLNLDSSVESHLPEFANRPGGPITVRQLLSHTSGYASAQGNDTHTDFTMDDQALARRVAGLVDTVPALAPESRYQYSNANYQIAGRIIEAVSGLSYAEFVETRVLAPMSMNESFVIGGERSDRAIGHVPWFGSHRFARTLPRSVLGGRGAS